MLPDQVFRAEAAALLARHAPSMRVDRDVPRELVASRV
jgi:hypothetical protein